MDTSNPNHSTSISGSHIEGTSIAIGSGAKASYTNQWGNPVQTPADLIAELEKLKEQLAQASKMGVVDEKTTIVAQSQVTKAVQQAQHPNPNKETIIGRLSAVKVLIEDITAASGLVTVVVGAIEAVKRLF